MASYNFLVSGIFIILTLDAVLGNSHLDSVNNLVTPNPRVTYDDTLLPLHNSSDKIYKRKHNIDPNINLHPTRAKLVKSTKAKDVDDFMVYYPEKNKKHDKNFQKRTIAKEEKKEEEGEQKMLPLILGSIGAGMYSESNQSMELFPGSLVGLVDLISNYFREGYRRFTRNLNNFFDAVDQNVKNGKNHAVFELNDYIF